MKTTILLAVLFIIALAGGYYWYESEAPTFGDQPEVSQDGYTMRDVSTHDTAQSCWSVIDGVVYDLTAWISDHPGGEAAILKLCGKDGTDAFQEEHSRNDRAKNALDVLKLGPLSN